jgi:hypothetical protein
MQCHTSDDRNPNSRWVALLSYSVSFSVLGFLLHDMWSLHMQLCSREGQGQMYVQDSSCQIVLLRYAPLANCVSWSTLQFLTTNLYCIELKLNAWLPLSPYFTPHWFTSFCFNDLCNYTSFLNLLPLIIGVTPFGWLHSITLTLYFLWEVIFDIRFFYLCPIITKQLRYVEKGFVSFTKRFTQHEKQTKFWNGVIYKDISKRLC